ncbi:MAG: acetyl-CoA carboxylase biotin carboxyl carrier protein [Treponemataceae bacterium]
MDDKTLITLVEKFGASDLTELELVDGSTRLSLKKANAGFTGSAAGAPEAKPVHLGLPARAEDAEKAAAAGHSVPAPGTEAITSPIVATFYKASGPDVPAFAEVGKKIKAGQTLCILEAMKMMNHLEAEFDCEIVAVKAANGDLVEYGQTLFEVKRL